MKHVILGDGVAGMSAAEVIRRERPGDRIVVVSDDRQPFYFRASLTNYLMGELAPEELWGLPPSAWEQLSLERRFGRVVGFDPVAQQVRFAEGEALRYDRLLVATGARARRLETREDDPEHGIDGADLPGVCVMRTLADTQRIIEALPGTKHAVVVGGGILGIEMAQGLRARNVGVTLVHRKPYLLERTCDRRAAELVATRMIRDGIDVRLGVELAEILPGRERGGRRSIASVRLSDDTEIACSLVGAAIGNVPNAEFAASSIILSRAGYVPVDDRMRVVGVENVWAAGDVATFEDEALPFANPIGLWQPAKKQGHVAGLSMSADDPAKSAPYRPGAIYGATRAWDLDLATLGNLVDPVDEARGERAVEVWSRVDGVPVYKKAVLRDGRIVGALLLGDRREGRAIQRLMNLKGDAGDVSSIADRLFDAEFDLFAWVAAQERRAGRAKRNAAVPVPRGPLPAAVVAAGGGHDAPRGTTGFTALARAPKLRIAAGATEASFEARVRFVRIGAAVDADVVVEDPFLGGEEIQLTAQGAFWVAASSAGRRARALRNGLPLVEPVAVEDGDALRLGRFQGFVRLDLPRERAKKPEAAPLRGFLIGLARHALDGHVTTIGRAKDCHVVVAGDVEVSSHHAQILVSGAPPAHYLSDAGSTNGTFVDEAPVHTMRRLRPGDSIRVGMTVFRYELEAAQSAAAPPDVASRRADARPAAASKPGPASADGAAPPRGVGPRAVEVDVGASAAGESKGGEAWLVGLEGPLARRALVLRIPGVLGRGVGVDVRVDDALLSRSHARFEGTPQSATVTDLGSANGIALDGARLEANVARGLAEGARLRIGRTLYRFQSTPPEDRILTVADTGNPHTGETGTVRMTVGGPRLEVLQAGEVGLHRLAGPKVTVGRDPHNDVVLGGDVSRDHLELVLMDGTYAAVDLGSANGTRVDDRPLEPNTPVRLADGATLRIATTKAVFRLGDGVASDPLAKEPRPRLTLEKGPPGVSLDPIALPGAGPWIVGRGEGAVRLPKSFEAVSRRHASIRRSYAGYELQDLGSTYKTAVNGTVVGAGWTPLVPGDVIRFDPNRDNHVFRFDVEGVGAAPNEAPSGAIDWSAVGNPLEEDLAAVVADELDACIGCHDCMRACPLEDARTVGIGALNALAGGVGTPSDDVRRFVADCTQCRACVPVCPVDIHRSRIVLWNKMKDVPSPSRRPSIQVGAKRVDSDATLGEWADRFAAHALVAPLSRPERLALFASARFRRLSKGEILVAEGAYADAIWIVAEGRLSLDAGSGGDGYAGLVRLAEGQTIGEVSVLSEEPSAYTARALGAATVVGLPKYALFDAATRSRPFQDALDGLHARKSVEALIAALPELADAPKAAVDELRAALVPERYDPGETIVETTERGTAFHFLRRGFVSEIRRTLEGREVTADYLRSGRTFGLGDSGRGGAFVRYAASTRVELLSLTPQRRTALVRRHRELETLLAPSAGVASPCAVGARSGPAPGDTAAHAFDDAITTGLAQARLPLVIDTRLCVDCDNCNTACERRHGVSRLDRLSSGVQVGPFHVPASCYHCADPVCLLCAVDGIVREPTGEIRIVEDACIGCGACAERCPYDNIQIVERAPEPKPLWRHVLPDSIWRMFGVVADEEPGADSELVAVKCDLCVTYADGPACVRACPVGAAQRVDVFGALGVAGAAGRSA